MSTDHAKPAGKQVTIDPNRVYAGFLLPNRQKWPRLNPEIQRMTGRFLAACLSDCKEAFEATERQIAIAPGHPGLESQRTYWLNVSSGIAWMMARLKMRQRFLALDLPETKPLEEIE